jgi:hypothetical protein
MPVSVFSVTGTFHNADNSPASGTVTFYANNDWDINTGVIGDDSPSVVTLNDAGSLPHVDLLCNIGGYHVVTKLGPPGNTVEFDLPSQTPFSVIDLSTIDPGTSIFHSEDIGAAAVPQGGTAGQVLTKLSSANYDDGWIDAGAVGVWRDGSGVPSDSLGGDGDYYLNDTTGDVYRRVTGAYGLVANILGPAGPTGPTGPTGPAGPSGAAGSSYVHTQNIPATVWTVNHNLGLFPNVTTVDTALNEFESTIVYIDSNSLTVTISVAVAGFAYNR